MIGGSGDMKRLISTVFTGLLWVLMSTLSTPLMANLEGIDCQDDAPTVLFC